jgi:hypothetical protein
MKKIISFSLWGDKPIYTVGAIANAVLAQEIYPGWICRFYIHRSSIPQNIIRELEKQSNVELVDMPEDIGWSAMLWRFYPATEEDVSVMLSRDCDSRLSQREKACVDYWLNKTDRKVMTIRDTCVHQSQMMGGLWGVRDGFLTNIKPFLDELIEETKQKSLKGVDQDFLNSKIYLHSLGILNGVFDRIHEAGYTRSQFISFDDIAFGEKRFENKEHRPHDRDWMVPTIVQRKYGNEYPVCGSCGLRHDNNFIGKDYSLTEDELKYLNLNEQEKEDRKNILKYYECYLKNKDKFGLTGLGN